MKLLKYLLVSTLLFFPVVASATIIIDQVNDNPYPYGVIGGPDSDSDPGQSFTVGITGKLASIEILGWNQSTFFPATREHTLSLFTLGSEYTLDNALASITQTANSYLEQWFEFDFSSFNIAVNQGDEYLMLWTSAGVFNWRYNYNWKLGVDTYDRGGRFIRNNSNPDGTFIEGQDQIFRTHVAVIPEPGILWLLGSGMIGLISIAKREKA